MDTDSSLAVPLDEATDRDDTMLQPCRRPGKQVGDQWGHSEAAYQAFNETVKVFVSINFDYIFEILL